METVRLTPHSRLRRLVMTSRLRLTGSAFQVQSPGPLRENAASECRDRACTGMTERKAFLQLVEGEHSFLGAVVVELLVLELQVFKLFAEHQARCEAGLWRPFGLQPHSRLRRLVKTSRLRLTGVLQTLETRGTVREARGLASRTNTLPSSIAYCMFMRPHTWRASAILRV